MSVHRNDQFGLPILAPYGAYSPAGLRLALNQVVLEKHPVVAIDLSRVEDMTASQARDFEKAWHEAVLDGTMVSLIGISPAAFRALGTLQTAGAAFSNVA